MSMPAARLIRPALRIPLLLGVVFSLLMVQALRVHFHSFADHDPLHGHSHPVELHLGGVPADSGHEDPDSEFLHLIRVGPLQSPDRKSTPFRFESNFALKSTISPSKSHAFNAELAIPLVRMVCVGDCDAPGRCAGGAVSAPTMSMKEPDRCRIVAISH